VDYRTFSLLTMLLLMANTAHSNVAPTDRALELCADLPTGPLKSQLQSCTNGPFAATEFSIAHRGAPLGYPEHSREGYIAAAKMGAGLIECDVTFTKDLELVCRHSQCDLASSTNILQTPLANSCRQPFTPAKNGQAASAQCCTSDITLTEFKTLCARPDITNTQATTIEEFLAPLASPVVSQPNECGTVMSHRDSIKLIRELGAKFIPELKRPEVPMPFRGLTQTDYADKLLAEYRQLGISASQVHPQSFNLADVKYWISNHSEYAPQAMWLVPRERQIAPPTIKELQTLQANGLAIIAPPIHMLVQQKSNGQIEPTAFARAAKASGLKVITWTFESAKATAAVYGDRPGLMLETLDVLAEDIGVAGVFSDWPGTVTYYANCMNNRQ
jgi:glycerophosphoryl diester phosphodiesterase